MSRITVNTPEQLIIEIGDVEYVLKEKTIELEEKIQELNDKATSEQETMKLYEYWIAIIKIAMGDDVYNTLFPTKENTNTLFLKAIYDAITKLYQVV